MSLGVAWLLVPPLVGNDLFHDVQKRFQKTLHCPCPGHVLDMSMDMSFGDMIFSLSQKGNGHGTLDMSRTSQKMSNIPSNYPTIQPSNQMNIHV